MLQSRIQAAWRGQLQCGRCPLRELALFADLEEPDFDLIHQPISELHYGRNRAIYSEGEEALAVFTIRSGLVKLEQTQADGGVRIVRLLRRGDTAGLESLVEGPYRHTAVAAYPVSVCRIPRDVVRRLNSETPRLSRQLMRRWEKAVDDADAWLTCLSTGPARARVARLILCLAETAVEGRFSLIRRVDMGAVLGITTESASRAVAEFMREGCLVRVDDGYYTGDMDELSKAAGHCRMLTH